VFEGVIQPGWQEQVEKSQLFSVLANSQEIDFDTYEKLHKKEQKTAVRSPKHEWILDHIEAEIPHLMGARYYKWID
jgi:hydroxymethylglutaryl-CoA synthase